MTQIDKQEIHKVAHLARLEMTEAEEEEFSNQVSELLDYVEQLQELDTDNVQPTAHIMDMRNIARADKHASYPHRDDLLDSAPEQEGEFFKVPKIL
ncbi:asparaginyl/glutamyl-tRNA amidotransferase subunit C [Leptolyngbya valderiana BDU 20041]|uniref:Asp-tRNA(Asn)/Glu-tRNA(Gln) amidotransferase subunit GatC n=1 Tax=Baaleninema simplex TaxID=2862350 RepID=UPI000346EF79|nr:Asp-tRNA(Asn)/Glu-tRNA(Gln) amidotransferase subunit GatC [Baaleninema simplex]MDC0831648.1 Asp-tRNA(Asn)/Glu-tRNA(Gln) amidotransferase subunit GatC [Geitlerinema sp. CS-897]OAB60627.1 asparaginyl/glutamyl-tRNA amidotransferase subunit C [Leptolyngbya valderiana BDU 20041]PPT09282.1 Aspartyl-tRNA(Asn) amidotransferase subunit C [Geitlerinema sp. FC II]